MFCMDHSYGALDVDTVTVVKSGSTVTPLLHNSPYIDSLLIKSNSSSNMQLSHAPTGFYVDRKIKCEEFAPDIFSRSAAVQLADTSARYSTLGGVELRGLRSMPVPSCVPAFDVMDYIASSNSFNFLASSDVVAQMSISTSMNGLGMHVIHHDQAGHANAKPHVNSMMVTSSLTGLPKGSMEKQALLEANQSFPSKNMGPSHADSGKKLGFYASDCISTSHLHVPSDNNDIFPDILARYTDSPNSPNSPSKQDSVLSAEDLADPDLRKTQIQTSKRRKTQQKRVVCVPVGDAKHLKGETPPSDLWAWRKYGQKPIKGSPYPRGYYRCSSSKGCSARKQVERSCTDPTMLIVTYTSDHNHDWPVAKSNSSNAQVLTPLSPLLAKDKGAEDQSEEVTTTTSSCELVNESLFSSIVNSVNSVDEQVASSLDVSLHDEESFSLKKDVDLCFLSRTSVAEDDGVFDDLGELPELSSIFSKGYLEDHQHVDDGWFVQ